MTRHDHLSPSHGHTVTGCAGRRLAGVAGAGVVHGVDDLRVVDSLEIDRGGPEVGMPELALDDSPLGRPHAPSPQHVRMAKLVGRRRAAYRGPCALLRSSRRTAGDHGRPRLGPCRIQNRGPTGSWRRCLARLKRAPSPRVQADLLRRLPSPARTSTAPRAGSRSVSASASASPTRNPGAPQHHDDAAADRREHRGRRRASPPRSLRPAAGRPDSADRGCAAGDRHETPRWRPASAGAQTVKSSSDMSSSYRPMDRDPPIIRPPRAATRRPDEPAGHPGASPGPPG